MKNIMITVFAIGLLILVGCGNPVPAQPTNTPLPPTNTPVPEVVGDPEKGRQIFESGGENET